MTTNKVITLLLISIFCFINSVFVKAQPYSLGFDSLRDSYAMTTDELQSNKIPDSVFRIISLKSLVISGKDCDDGGAHDDNKPNDGLKCWMINEIPPQIGNLINLDTLMLTLGAFRQLPKEISNLVKLKYLDLTDSNMSDVDNLTSLISLNKLLLFGCHLSNLPRDIGKLKNLKFLGLVGNNLSDTEIERIRKALPNCEVYYH